MKNYTRKMQQVAGLGLAALVMVMTLNVGQAAAAVRSAHAARGLDRGAVSVLRGLNRGAVSVLGRRDRGAVSVLRGLDRGAMSVLKGRAVSSAN
jgi:hypothetical protein